MHAYARVCWGESSCFIFMFFPNYRKQLCTNCVLFLEAGCFKDCCSVYMSIQEQKEKLPRGGGGRKMDSLKTLALLASSQLWIGSSVW